MIGENEHYVTGGLKPSKFGPVQKAPLGEPTATDVIIQGLKQNCDYLERRLKLLEDVRDAQSELVKLHEDIADRAREKVNQLEQLLAMIPGCDGNFHLAKDILLQLLRTGIYTTPARGGQSASARPLRDAQQDQAEHKAECTESLCMGVVRFDPDRFDLVRQLWCSNCAAEVARMTPAEYEELKFTSDAELRDFWQLEWNKHIGKEPGMPARPVMSAQEHNAFPKGRW